MNNRPNIVLITIDALRPDHLGFMGYKENTSPNIDSLAKESIVFKNAFSVGPTTPYSFPSILTSTYPLDYQGPREIKKPRVLINEVLKKEGYITAALHSSPYLSDYFGYNQGWDFYEDIHFSTDSSSPSRFKKLFNKIIISTFPRLFFWMVYLRYKINGPKKVKARASFVNQVVKDFIYSVKSKNQPIFIWIHYMDTHTPPLCYSEKGGCSYGQLLGDCVGSAIWSYENKGALKRFIKKNFKKYLGETLSSYDKAIKYLDKEVGELLNFLKKQNIYQDSILCVTSDHGDEFLEHGGMGHNIQLYNEVLAVPLLIRFPESSSKGVIIKKKVSLIDLAPTLCDLAGVQKPSSFKGENLFNRPNQTENLIFHQSAFSKKEGHHLDIEKLSQCRIACQSDNWKYILDHGTRKEEIYDLYKDPGEKNNVFESNPEVLLKMRKKVEEFEEINPPLSKI